jgi:glycosyltransferase involved in cell wall biosynthesis
MENSLHTDSHSRRILFITPQPFLADRGSPLRVKSEVESLSALGYEIDVLCFPYGKELDLEGVTLHRSVKVPGIQEPAVGPSWQKIVLDIPLGFKSLLLGLRNKYQVIHGVEEAAFMAAIIGTMRRTPYIVDMHSLLPDQLQYSGFLSNRFFIHSAYGAYNWCLKRAGGIIAVCKDVQDYATQIAPHVPCAQLEDLPLESSWHQKPELMEQLVRTYNLQDSRVLTYTGNFSSYQGIPLLLESFKKSLTLLKNPDTTKLLLVGESNDALVTEVRQMVETLGITGNVVFTGEMPSDMMGTVMGISDAVISPRSKGSNTPLKLYCYMASGKPIVATAICSHTQVLSDDAAYLADPNPESLANAISQALEESETAFQSSQKKAERAKQILDQRFNKKNFQKSMGWLYERVTNAPLPVSVSSLKKNEKYSLAA